VRAAFVASLFLGLALVPLAAQEPAAQPASVPSQAPAQAAASVRDQAAPPFRAKPLLAWGVGGSFLDGLVRLDTARAVRDPQGRRVDL
jgi:hypothetical protein